MLHGSAGNHVLPRPLRGTLVSTGQTAWVLARAGPARGGVVIHQRRVASGVVLVCSVVMMFVALPRAEGAPAASPQAELDVQNNLVTDNGGVLQFPDFSFQVNGEPPIAFAAGGTNQLFLDPSQTYTITEVPPSPPAGTPGYTTTYDNCTNITLDVNQPTTCVITNDDIAPVTTTVSTTTFVPQSTTTVPGGKQVTVHRSETDENICHVKLDPEVQPAGTTKIKVTLATDAFPQPHLGDPIRLSNGVGSVAVPAGLLQVGVDAGLIHDGDTVPSDVTLVVAGQNTNPPSHKYATHVVSTIRVIGGKAQPISGTQALPDTTWTPVDKNADVFIAEKSLSIVSHVTIPGLNITATFSCTSTAAPFVAVGATGNPNQPVQGTGSSGTGATTSPIPIAAAGAATGSNELPRTGTSPWPLAIVATFCVGAGLAVTGGARRAGRRRRGLG
ncbi:MAG: large repetitive protein [Ilumatobacteraceae bacterium]